MASQRDIRRRIGSVKNIKQITRAMQFVAASKLKRAQDATLAARPYSEKLDEVLADLAAVLGQEDHPLLAEPKEGKRLIVLITTDRPLSGPLNTNIVRFVARDIIDNPGDVSVITVGRYDEFRSRTRIDLPAWGPLSASITYLHREIDGWVENKSAGLTRDFQTYTEGHIGRFPHLQAPGGDRSG